MKLPHILRTIATLALINVATVAYADTDTLTDAHVVTALPTPDAVANLPIIFLEGPTDILVDRETWFPGHVSFLNPRQPEHDATGLVADIRGRGNSTWHDGPDKRPLRFRFPADAPQGVFYFEHEARTWILLANHFDQSLLRNYAALHLGGQLSTMAFTPGVQNVHLYFNGEYMGVYLLTDERDLDPGRAQLTLHDDPTISEFFLEFDGRADQDARTWYDYVRVHQHLYDIRFPSGSRRSVAQGEYVYDFLTQVSDAFRSRDWARINQWVNMDSFVDFYLVQELLKNTDFSFSSVFMTIQGQGAERRLHMGPLWDFDIAAGGVRFHYDAPLYVQGMETPYGVIGPNHYWVRNLMFIPEFNQMLYERWRQVRDTYWPRTLSRLDQLMALYSEDFERNFERHPVLGTAVVPTTSPAKLGIDTHLGQVEHLLAWFDTRVQWLDGYWYGLAHPAMLTAPSTAPMVARGFADALWTRDFIGGIPVSLWLDGQLVPSTADIAGVRYQEHVMLPLRFIVESLGGEIGWDNPTNSVTFTTVTGQVFSFPLNHPSPLMETVPLVLFGNTMVPLSFVAEHLVESIVFDEASQTLILNAYSHTHQ